MKLKLKIEQCELSFEGRYPHTPGSQMTSTSKAAARQTKGIDKAVRQKAFALLEHRDLTSDEIAEILNVHPLNVRPRCSQLRDEGVIFDSGAERNSSLGNPMIVWTRKKR